MTRMLIRYRHPLWPVYADYENVPLRTIFGKNDYQKPDEPGTEIRATGKRYTIRFFSRILSGFKL